MMSKKQWCVLLILFIIYLLLGAAIFYNIESKEETKRMAKELEERREIEDLLRKYMMPKTERKIFKKLSEYCGKTLETDMSHIPYVRKWDFYYSLFFVITVVSTIGYGNLAPTTMFSRIFMIFYGLIGIPMNGIVMVTLGGFFGRSFTKLYHRWKTSKMQYDTTRLGLISQIILYLVPGFTFFIFLPSVIMTLFEGWEYDVAVYFSFVTLTTIGFGDYVAGIENVNQIDDYLFTCYKIFLLIWIIGGLGYVVMVLHFITQAMRSKKVHAIEQIISENIKKTPTKIRHELRSLLQEFLFLKAKRTYKGEFDYIPTLIERSQSCPDLTIYRTSPNAMRKRALSECPRILDEIQSENDLEKIDKDLTDDYIEQQKLLLKVVDALSNCDNNTSSLEDGYEGFLDNDILESENYNHQWSIKSRHPSLIPPKRRRAVSEVKEPSYQNLNEKQDLTWYGQEALHNWNNFRNRTLSIPTSKESPSLLSRFKNRFRLSNRDGKVVDIERQDRDNITSITRSTITNDENSEENYIRRTANGRPSILSIQQEKVLENTSIADFIRALSVVSGPETLLPQSETIPKRKLGNANILPSTTTVASGTTMGMRRLIPLKTNLSNTRRTSLISTSTNTQTNRRFSLRPVEEHLLAPPPPYTPNAPTCCSASSSRKFIKTFISPIQKQINNKRDS